MALPQPNDRFRWTQTPAGPSLVCTALEPYAHHFFTTSQWTLGSPSADRNAGWNEVATAADVDEGHLTRVHQVHGAAAILLRRGQRRPGGDLPDADILLTDDPSTALAIQTADCVPILIADRRGGNVAAAHAGWRGLAARVPEVAVAAMVRELGSRADDLVAAIGPSICADRYEVGADVYQRFEAAGFRAELSRWFSDGVRPSHWQFDGAYAARDQLAAAGVPPPHIFAADLCTATHDNLLCSYRRDGRGAGRMAAVIRKLGSTPLAIT
jgi:purine-nucleoside/S-methyl-5'-thioadenosine phosphorylase / adenosine deaminase